MKSFSLLRFLGVGVVVVILLSGCLIGYGGLIYSANVLASGISKEQTVKKVMHYALNPEELEQDIPNLQANFKKIVIALTKKVAEQWSKNNTQTPLQEVYVKYTDSYLSHARVDVTKVVISVATLETENPKIALKNAIVSTLLTPENPEQGDLYSDKVIPLNRKPYLADLIKDHENQTILYPWRVNRYADYLIVNALKTMQIVENGKSKKVYYVQFDMIKDHVLASEHKYREYVDVREYDLEQALIFVIIKSSFNPYVVSHIPAYGLMQIVPASAGWDVYNALNHKDGISTKEMLFTPKINIQYGSMYLHILFTRYIKGIYNALSHEYCVIAAYNTGSWNMLSVFDRDHTAAIKTIHSMTSSEVYRELRTSLKYEEARNYLHKVTNAKMAFQKSLARNMGDHGSL